jgi:HK97 family phage major capsid protein
MFINDQQDFAARKNCIPLLRDIGVKSLTEITPHKMTWADLNTTEKRLKTTASNLIDKLEGTTGEIAEQIGAASDAVLAVFDAIKTEKDIRMEIGSREPRESAMTPQQAARRPGVDAVDTSADHGSASDLVSLLGPQERFATWAQARANTDDAYRGLGLGQYLRSMIVGGKSDIERRALNEGSDSAGGYTVPSTLSAQLVDMLRAQSVVVRAGARTVPLTSDRHHIAKLLTDPVPAWRAEAAEVAESDPTFGLIEMAPRSLAVMTKISYELMEDSLNLATELPRVLAAAMAVELDRVALLGTGTAPQPRGIVNTVGIGTFAQNAEIAGWANLSRARTGILTNNAGPVTAFIMHPRDEGTFTDLQDSTGQPLRGPTAVTNIPMLTTTSIPVDGGTGDDESTIIAGNFAHLLVGIRSDIRIEVIREAFAGTLQYAMIAHMRADIAVQHPGAFYTLTGVGRAA